MSCREKSGLAGWDRYDADSIADCSGIATVHKSNKQDKNNDKSQGCHLILTTLLSVN